MASPGNFESAASEVAALNFDCCIGIESELGYSIAFHAEDFAQLLYAGNHGLVGLPLGAQRRVESLAQLIVAVLNHPQIDRERQVGDQTHGIVQLLQRRQIRSGAELFREPFKISS